MCNVRCDIEWFAFVLNCVIVPVAAKKYTTRSNGLDVSALVVMNENMHTIVRHKFAPHQTKDANNNAGLFWNCFYAEMFHNNY